MNWEILTDTGISRQERPRGLDVEGDLGRSSGPEAKRSPCVRLRVRARPALNLVESFFAKLTNSFLRGMPPVPGSANPSPTPSEQTPWKPAKRHP